MLRRVLPKRWNPNRYVTWFFQRSLSIPLDGGSAGAKHPVGAGAGLSPDEYVGIDKEHSAAFRLWLRTRIEQKFNPAAFYYIEGDAPDTAAECAVARC